MQTWRLSSVRASRAARPPSQHQCLAHFYIHPDSSSCITAIRFRIFMIECTVLMHRPSMEPVTHHILTGLCTKTHPRSCMTYAPTSYQQDLTTTFVPGNQDGFAEQGTDLLSQHKCSSAVIRACAPVYKASICLWTCHDCGLLALH